MIVCSCNVLSDGQIRACLDAGPACPRTAAQVYQCLGCSPKCGRCARTIRSIVAAALGTPESGEHACAASCAAVCPLAAAVEHAHGEHIHGEHTHGEHTHVTKPDVPTSVPQLEPVGFALA